MSEKKKIFRKVSLERLSSPEQLDQLMQVTSPKGWIALMAVVGLLAIAMIWGFLGYIPTTANGDGILLRRGGVSTVVSAGSGQVEEILVAVGDVIQKGQIVAKIRQEGIERQIGDARARMQALETELASLEKYADTQTRLSEANVEQKRSNLRLAIETLNRRHELLTRNLNVQKELLADGLVTQQTVLSSEQQVNQVRDELAAKRLELDGLELTRLQSEQQLLQQLEDQRSKLRDLELELREKQASLEESVQVVATEDGRVLELLADSGSVISPGEPILSMEVVSEDLMAVMFVPAELGKQVQPGMETRITPSTVKVEEHGFILGEVRRVSEFPSTSRGMKRLLGNDDLVAKMMEQGPPIQVDVFLRKDEATPTGFKWSSSTGPDIEISSGTLARGSVIVERSRPITLVIPLAKKKMGL